MVGKRVVVLMLVAGGAVGCTPKPEPFELKFAATANGSAVDCSTPISGLGPTQQDEVGLSDLRFFVSNLRLLDENGESVETTLDANDFQYASETGWVGLVDLTGNTDGTCAATAIAYAEGTARTNDRLTGLTVLSDVTAVSFDVGVPQALMKEVIGSTTAEAAPSPLNELYWSWATGYRHFVFNMAVTEGSESGAGYLHVGSTDCAAEGDLALENQDTCGFVNTPEVALADFSLETNVVSIDLPGLLAGLDFEAPVYDPETFEEIGTQPGVECHSSPMQPDCPSIFDSLGVDMETGVADASANLIFGAQ